MRRLLSVAVASALTLMVGWMSSPVNADDGGPVCTDNCGVDDEDTTTYNGEPLTVPNKGKAYCDDEGWPVFHSVGLDNFLTKSDTTVKSRRTVSSEDRRSWPEEPIVVPNIAIAQQFVLWCSTAESDADSTKANIFWIPIASPDSVALNANLLARVQGRLTTPDVVWLDIDKDHGWLWVRIEHHVGISAPVPVSESASAGNEFTGYASAWVKAVPVSFSIELPPNTGVKGSQLAACDLTKATSESGCMIRFTHASSVEDDGWFTGYAQVEWAVSSNSGKYNGLGPFITSTEVRFQVAESMAVSRPGG